MTKKFIILLKIGTPTKEKTIQFIKLKNKLPQPCRLLLTEPSDKLVVLTCNTTKTFEVIDSIVRKHSHTFADYNIVDYNEHRSKHNVSPLDIDKTISNDFAELYFKRKNRSISKTVLVERKIRKKYKQNQDRKYKK